MSAPERIEAPVKERRRTMIVQRIVSPARATLACACLLGVALSACTFQRFVTNTPRSATEQLLLTHALEEAVEELSWPEVADRDVAVEVVSLNGADASYLEGVLAARARSLGARVVPRDQADLVLVVLAGGFGTVSRDAEFGIPSIPLPGGLATPSLPILRVLRQRGYARLRIVAHDASGAQTFSSPTVLKRAHFDVYGFFFLALQRNNIYPGEASRMDVD